MPDPSQFEENIIQNVGSSPDHSWDGFLMDFGGNLTPSWDPKWSQNRYERGLEK